MQKKNKKETVRLLLAEFLGTEPQDIEDADSLTNDLHIDPVAMSDFMKTLEEEGFEHSGSDLTEIDTFEDLVDSLNSEYGE